MSNVSAIILSQRTDVGEGGKVTEGNEIGIKIN